MNAEPRVLTHTLPCTATIALLSALSLCQLPRCQRHNAGSSRQPKHRFPPPRHKYTRNPRPGLPILILRVYLLKPVHGVTMLPCPAELVSLGALLREMRPDSFPRHPPLMGIGVPPPHPAWSTTLTVRRSPRTYLTQERKITQPPRRCTEARPGARSSPRGDRDHTPLLRDLGRGDTGKREWRIGSANGPPARSSPTTRWTCGTRPSSATCTSRTPMWMSGRRGTAAVV